MIYPRVSIIVLNWNGIEDTIECLESLRKVTYHGYEVVIVDNASDGNDVEILRDRFGDYVHIIRNDRNYGFAEGNNIGMKYALTNFSPDYILLLNNDTTVDPEFLTELINVAEGEVAIGIAGPKVYSYHEPDRLQFVRARIDMCRGRATNIGVAEIDAGQYDNVLDTDYVQGSCFLVKREVIERIGLLDARYFCYWEETDYCIRARRAGYRMVYCPGAKIWHKVGSSAKKISGLSTYYITRNRFWFIRKHGTHRQVISSLLYFFLKDFWLFSGIFLIYHRNPKVLLSFYKGIKDGLLSRV